MIAGLANKLQYVKFLLNDHSPAILTGVGVAGTVATAYLTGRASFKASKIIDAEQETAYAAWREGEQDSYPPREFTRIDMAKLTWKLYIPAVATGSVTVTSIIAANKISSKRLAALAVASGITERAFQEYKDKVMEKLGANQETKVRDELAQEKVSSHPVRSGEVIITGTGEVLCYDMSSGRYFQSTVENIRRAENRINYELIHFMSASLSMFYEELGLPPTSYSDSVGWNMNNNIEVVFSTTMSSDERPCIAIDFRRQPTSDFEIKAWEK